MRAYAVVDVEVLGFIGWSCPRCGERHTRMVERGQAGWLQCQPPPESPKGACAAVILPPEDLKCIRCRNRFRPVAART